MKNLFLLLMLIASPAWANWTVVQSSNGTDFYIDFETVKVEGSKRKAWQLSNYSTLQSIGGYEFSSMRVRVEFDCKEEKSRFLTLSVFSSPNASGKPLVTNYEPAIWQDLAPSTTGWNILKLVCKAPAR